VLKLHPDELVRLAPRLRLYLRRPDPTWPEVVDAADWLRHDLDVSKRFCHPSRQGWLAG
jgi:replication initiation protein RepC